MMILELLVLLGLFSHSSLFNCIHPLGLFSVRGPVFPLAFTLSDLYNALCDCFSRGRLLLTPEGLLQGCGD